MSYFIIIHTIPSDAQDDEEYESSHSRARFRRKSNRNDYDNQGSLHKLQAFTVKRKYLKDLTIWYIQYWCSLANIFIIISTFCTYDVQLSYAGLIFRR